MSLRAPFFAIKCAQSDCCSIWALQVAAKAGNTASEEMSRQELLKVLNNVGLYHYTRFFEEGDSTGKERLAKIRKKIQTADKIRKASAQAVIKLSSALNAGAGWGLEAYLPSKRLLPGAPFELDIGKPRSVLVFTADEGPDMKLSHAFLSSVGLRCRSERDFWHRLDNTHANAVGLGHGYADAAAKALFLSRVNRAPWGSGANANLKAELLAQFDQVGRNFSASYQAQMWEAGVLFDEGLKPLGRTTEKLLDDMIGSAKTIHERTEGATWLQ